MKSMSFLALCVSLILLTSCEQEDVPPAYEGSYDPLTCLKSSPGCGVNWYVSLARDAFPDSVQIMFNEKIIIDDCDPQSNWSRKAGTMTNEYTIQDYADLDGTQNFSMRIYDRLDCYSPKKEHSFEIKQSYKAVTVGREKQIWIKKEKKED